MRCRLILRQKLQARTEFLFSAPNKILHVVEFFTNKELTGICFYIFIRLQQK
ncbi:hypothetical protein KsCSTR_40460 [Candidatus Kuenenia stuttgartiensis]|uniref:Uncharacterized protein n=1 Tax=Kuenenia stuttgartiensis TaxID=174633 RepID=Q1Q7N2_KUEST|nr:hypothetical protein KsCSTR_40460 [Candidatus Kuenenia stuttgartiensis]CAJ70825.1 unknown protein [Candidatus Kuenenia stuttgartiensis]